MIIEAKNRLEESAYRIAETMYAGVSSTDENVIATDVINDSVNDALKDKRKAKNEKVLN